MPTLPPPTWDVFCRVIDNHGDVGVCWRLARALAQRGPSVRLWIDDASALTWMAPGGAAGVQVLPWAEPLPTHRPGDVVIEAFGCELPAAFVTQMAQRQQAPVWINLEYLSAEDYVERSHRLRSPQWSGPGAGLDKWFFYPGFTTGTGGLIHDLAPPAASAQALPRKAGERVVSVFCYDNPQLDALVQALGDQPTLLLASPGPAQARLARMALPPGVRWLAWPHLPQPSFDQLLATTDLNLVRGEDSFARAQLQSDAPFVWQIYPQDDGAHAPKLEAFLGHYLAGCEPALAKQIRQVFCAFNGLASMAPLPSLRDWGTHHRAWRRHLLAQPDLCTQLMQFVASR